MNDCALYQLIFPSGKRYTGISVHPARRLREHLIEARKGSHLPVHRAIRKYGSSCVSQVIIARGERSQIQEMEVATIAACKGYNASRGGEEAPMLGHRHSAETIARMRATRIGRVQSPEWVAKRTATQIGARRSDESRQRMSEGQKRRVRTPAELARMKDMAANRVMTPEYRANLSRAATARWARKNA